MKEKTALSKLDGVKWCDIPKEWYKKAYLSQWEVIQRNLMKHLKEIHFVRGGVSAALAKASFSGLRSP